LVIPAGQWSMPHSPVSQGVDGGPPDQAQSPDLNPIENSGM